jgi:hypothetical protein
VLIKNEAIRKGKICPNRKCKKVKREMPMACIRMNSVIGGNFILSTDRKSIFDG